MSLRGLVRGDVSVVRALGEGGTADAGPLFCVAAGQGRVGTTRPCSLTRASPDSVMRVNARLRYTPSSWARSAVTENSSSVVYGCCRCRPSLTAPSMTRAVLSIPAIVFTS